VAKAGLSDSAVEKLKDQGYGNRQPRLKMVSWISLANIGISADITDKKVCIECFRSGVYKNFTRMGIKIEKVRASGCDCVSIAWS
jgi:hypothetical protein